MTQQRLWALALAAVGLGVAVYLTATHYFAGAVPLACTTSGPVNCEQVTSSAQSIVAGIPVAVFGVVWFGVELILLLADRSLPTRTLALARLGWTSIGLLVVLYLIYAELFLIGALCAWCTAVHALVIGLFLLALSEVTAVEPLPA
ncbi:MAG: vitamin K epoxide reductase family protein [Chloroflexi bacterium]|nr:vitamin K epoxide reductase family protein [Chloroflexota bacterium]